VASRLFITNSFLFVGARNVLLHAFDGKPSVDSKVSKVDFVSPFLRLSFEVIRSVHRRSVSSVPITASDKIVWIL